MIKLSTLMNGTVSSAPSKELMDLLKTMTDDNAAEVSEKIKALREAKENDTKQDVNLNNQQQQIQPVAIVQPQSNQLQIVQPMNIDIQQQHKNEMRVNNKAGQTSVIPNNQQQIVQPVAIAVIVQSNDKSKNVVDVAEQDYKEIDVKQDVKKIEVANTTHSIDASLNKQQQIQPVKQSKNNVTKQNVKHDAKKNQQHKNERHVNNKAANREPVKMIAPQQQPNNGVGFNIHNFMLTPEQVAKKKAEAANAIHATDVILNNQQQQPVQPVVAVQPQINQVQIVQPMNTDNQQQQRQYVSKDQRHINDKLSFLKTKYKFISGNHPNLTHANLDSLINLLNSTYLKDFCKKYNALDNATLTEMYLEQNETDEFDFAFKILTTDPKHPLKVLFNSNPIFDERTGRWVNKESVQVLHNEHRDSKRNNKNKKSKRS